MQTLVHRHGYATLVLANLAAVIILFSCGLLSEWTLVAVHYGNIVALVACEFIAPLNPRWLVYAPGRGVRWRLLLKTYLWFLFDSRVWFVLHGMAIFWLAGWLAEWVPTLNLSILPAWLQVLVLALVVDLVRYWIHRGAHAAPLLWRFHRMHHTPTNMTPVRAWWTHPVDDLMLYSAEIVLMVLLGFEGAAIFAFLSLDNFFQLQNHANCHWRSGKLGWLLQHPRYHLLHHRAHGRTVNFGEMFTIWDRLFGTFERAPAAKMRSLEIGVEPLHERSLFEQLLAPLRP